MPQSSQDATCLPQRHGWHDKTQQTLNWGTLRCLTLHSKNDGSFFLGISPTFTKPISKIAKSREEPLEVAPESDQVEALDQASNCEATCGNLFINSPECTYNIIQCILTVAVFCCNSYGSQNIPKHWYSAGRPRSPNDMLAIGGPKSLWVWSPDGG